MLHAVPGRPSAFARRSRIDVRGDHEQRHRLFVSLSDGRDDVGRAAARGNQADRRLLSSTRVAEGHVSRAPFMLRVDEPEVRTLRYGIAQRKRGMGQHAEDMPDILRAKILYHRFGNVRFSHASDPPSCYASLVQAGQKSNTEWQRNKVIELQTNSWRAQGIHHRFFNEFACEKKNN